ncbi:hypothetical protein PVAND_009325 [Polypedilum vanderplanki]|uniref:FAD-binding PCMH-type domain-containing protein n=1 Tax=Polypedilum vanderplanki TaxID=319348 RepID=A0A9J6CDE5_POLVA|nr:hypothetical protein PVAND_009325 [Polypedilum vanderplanki]
MLHWFSGTQVRNVASIGGNIVTSSPISDLNPILLAAGAKLEVQTSLMKGKEWNRKLIEIVNQSLIDEIPLSFDAPGGNVVYRRSLTLSLFFKAFLSISQELDKSLNLNILTDRDRSGIESYQNLTPKSSQLFENVSSDQPLTDPVLVPKFIHQRCNKQQEESNLFTKAHAKIISIDASEALKQPGIHAFFTAKDVDQSRFINGLLAKDEEIFISETVTSEGQILGAIVGDNQIIAQRAAKLVKVEYEELSPVIITLEDAIKQNSYFPGFPHVVSNGNIEKILNEADHVIKGEVRLGGQEHFYIETHSNLAIPKDADEIEIFSSTQQPGEVQRHVANFLNIPQNKVVCRTKRIGGGFGGKETRGSLATLPVAFAAYKLKRPVRMILDRDEDMMITGGRNPMLFKYKIACTKEGKILGCDVRAFINAGYSLDYSHYVIESAYSSIANCYKFNVVNYEFNVLKTNTRSNTAFRGFGSPQGMLAAETIIRDVARITGKDYLEIMDLNMCENGYVLHYKQILENCNIRRCFEEVKINSDLENRRKSVAKFNSENRWKKRGISIVNNLFGIGFPPKFMNQGGALVHIYLDGSVLVSHGGVEMGQGLHTKMIQVASRVLNVPMEIIHIQETATDKVPNATSTAASVSSDLYGGAVMNACEILNERLAPYKKKMPNASWDDWIKVAYFDRVSLSTTGFYATPDIGPEINKPKNYFTHGSAVSEVEIDCLTGDHQVIRTDIVMDVGSSLNPAIDIGQIEGAFMQGYGLFVLEELIYSPNGTLYSRGPGMYKIPSFGNIPAEFNVSLLTDAPNPRAVFSSRAVGEPPLFLASSVYFAIKEAIGAARKEEGLDSHFYLQAPATAARIRVACQDKIVEKFETLKNESLTPWNVDL